MIPIYKAFITDKSIEYANDAISSTWISSIGEYIDRASIKLAKMCGVKHALLTNNGTSATHLVCKSLRRYNKDIKRILVPSACYVAVYNSLLYDKNDWEIVCVDLDLDTWNMNIKEVDSNDVIFAVHNLGNIINVSDLIKKTGCIVVEDNCEGIFGEYSSVPAGSKSFCSSLSFFGNKNITCGEGGALLTNDDDVHRFSKKILGQGQSEIRYVHDELGYNYRMTNVQAAILLGQLESSEEIIKNKKRVFETYRKNLSNLEGIKLQVSEKNTVHSNWMFGVRIVASKGYEYAKNFFQEFGIETRPMFYPYTKHKHLDLKGEHSVATLLNKEVIILPSYPSLLDSEIEHICDSVVRYQKTTR